MVTVLVLAPPGGNAAETVPFAARKTFNDNGAIALIGNTLLTCPTSASGCTAAKAASSGGAEVNNNNYVMENVDRDTDASTVNSSSSQLLLPGGSSVLWAGLYWGARLQKGDLGAAPTKPRNQMSLRGPTDASYRTITSQVEFGPNGTDQAYQEFTDVTSIVSAGGAGTWWGANVAAATGKDRYAGWTLVVAYRNPALPLRNLTVFDGFNKVASGAPQTITISGFLAPLAGPVQTQLGMVAYEGDLGSTEDSASLTSGSKTTTLATAASPGNNFFNGSNDRNGQNVTTRNPSDRNMLGFDIMDFGAPNTIPNGQTSATIKLSTGGDVYYPGIVTTAIDLFAPDFTSSVKTVTNVDGHDPAGPGDTLDYTVNLVNSGSDPAGSSVLTDPLPPNTTYVPGSLVVVNGPSAGPKTDAPGDDQAEFIAASRTVRFRLGTGANASAGGVIGVNAITTVSFRVTLDSAAAGTTVSNRASLAYTAQTIGQPFTYSTNTTDSPVVANADLALTKTTTPDPVIAGQRATSTIRVHNNGPNAADNTEVSDALPGGVTFVSATPSSGTCTVAGGTVSCSLGTLASGATATVTVVVQVLASSTDDALSDVASVSSDTTDPNLQNNTAGSTVGIGTSADLTVTKGASPASVAPGERVTFPVTVHNNGPSDAQSVSVSDPLDSAELTLVSIDHTDVCTASAGGFNCALASLAAGATFTVNLVAQVPPDFTGTSVSNTATVTSATPDPVPGNNADSVTVAVTAPRADVGITKAGDPSSVVAGGRVTYTLAVTNPDGPSNAADIAVSDTLPAGLTGLSVVSDQGTCQLGPPISCDLGTMLVGGSATITITAAVDPNAPLQPVTNSASVTTSSVDPDPANNSASAVTTVTGEADVGIIKTDTSVVTGGPVAGGPIDYALVIHNSGPSTARGVIVTDVLPDTLTSITAGAPCTVTGQTVSCALAALPVGANRVFVIHATVVNTFPGGDITNTATVATTVSTDPNPDNDSATVVSTAGAAADLSITKSAPAAVDAGGTLTYQLVVTNGGPSAAAGVTVSDPMPGGMTAQTATTGQGTCAVASTVTCDLGTVSPGGTVNIAITVTVDPATPSGTRLDNTATVDSTTRDPTDSNNSATARTTVDTSADIAVTKTLLTAPPLAPGQLLQFQILVHNIGPSAAQSITLRDVANVDASVTGVTINGVSSLGDCTTSGANLFCPIGDLAPGDTTTVVLSARTDPGAALGPYANDAQVSSLTPDPEPTNNTSSAPFELAQVVSDVAIAKTGDAELVAGNPFTYTLTVNATAGPSDAQGVVVTDPVPTGLTASTALPSQGSCTIAGGVVTCDLGTVVRLAQPVTVTLIGTVDAAATPGPISNTASVTTTTPDPNPANDTATFDSTIVAQADLAISKVPDTDPLVAGTSVGWTLTVTNAGPSDATPVTLQDALPATVVFDPGSSDPSCTQTTTVTCALGLVPAGTTRVVRIAGQLDSGFTGSTLANTATVSSPVDDPNPADNSDTATSTVSQQADVEVTKLADSVSPAAGSDVTYAITVINNGPSDAVNTSFSDDLPLPPVGVVLPPQGDLTCAPPGLHVQCSVPLLRAGESRTGQITIHLPANQPAGPVANTATVTSATPDPDLTNNSDTASVVVVISADLKITKTVLTDPVVAGAPVSYRLDVLNQGPSVAPNVLVTDPLSPDVTLTSASAGCISNVVETGGTIVACGLGTVAVGATASVTITVTPRPRLTGTLSNTATAGSDALDPSPSDNTATVTSPIATQSDLAVTLTGPATVDAGADALFHIGFQNLGPSDASNVVITNVLPAGLTPHAPAGCTVSGQTLTCTLASLPAGGSGGIDLTVSVDPGAATGTVFEQHATIAGDQADPNPANNSASLQSTVARATDVGVTVHADSATVTPGSVVGFTVTVTNHGPLVAHGVTLTNTLPAEVTGPADPPSCTFVGNTATCDLGTLAVGASVTIHFHGTVPGSTALDTKLVDSATVTRDEIDNDATNDHASASTTVVAETAVLPEHVSQSPGGSLAFTGENVAFELQAALLLITLGGVALAVGWRPRRARGEPSQD